MDFRRRRPRFQCLVCHTRCILRSLSPPLAVSLSRADASPDRSTLFCGVDAHRAGTGGGQVRMRAHCDGLRPRSALRVLPPVSPVGQPHDGRGAGRHLFGPKLGHAARVSGVPPPTPPPEAPTLVCAAGSRARVRVHASTPLRLHCSAAVTNSVSRGVRTVAVGRTVRSRGTRTLVKRVVRGRDREPVVESLQPEPVWRRITTIEPIRGVGFGHTTRAVVTRARLPVTAAPNGRG